MEEADKKTPKGYPTEKARKEALQSNRARYYAKRTLMSVSFNMELDQESAMIEYARNIEGGFSVWVKELLANELKRGS